MSLQSLIQVHTIMVETLRSALAAQADPAYKARIRHLYNMDVSRYLGVRLPVVRKLAATHYGALKATPIDALLERCEELLKADLFELKTIAFDWSFRARRRLSPEHFLVLEDWLLRYVDDWMDCDDFCTHTLGAFLVRYPDFLSQTEAWATSENRWVRRASAVSLIYGLRRGKLLGQAFRIAQTLLNDEDDLVQKGCGWMLKEASRKHTDAVFDFVMLHRAAMPRTMLRYAVEKFDDVRRQQAMQRPSA